jgi:hypothetical protein
VNKLKVGKEEQESYGDNHRDLWMPLISDYIDGALAETASVRLQAHLSECPTCTADLEGLQQTQSLLRRLPEIPAPRSFTLTPAQAQRLRPSRIYRVAQFATAMAAAFLLFAFAFDLTGLFAGSANPNNSVALNSATPTPTLDSVGSLGGSVTRPNGGSVVGLTTDITPTSAPAPTPGPAVAANQSQGTFIEALPLVRWVEIGLLLVVIMMAAFAFALRPRAPARL